MQPRRFKIRLFPVLTGLLLIVASVLLAASLLGLFSAPVAPDLADRETPAPPATEGAAVVHLGLDLGTLGPVNPSNETFFASFEFWVLGTEIPPPSDFVFPDAVAPIRLGAPVLSRDTADQSYARYRVEGTFRYRSKTEDLLAGRVRLGLRILDGAQTSAQVLLFPARIGINLAPGVDGNRPTTADGVWAVSSSTIGIRRVFQPTFGDPAVEGDQTSHSEVAASFVLTRASPSLDQLAQRIVPAQFALPVLGAMACLLLSIPVLGRFDGNPGPWRRFSVLLALTLLLAAAQHTFAAYAAPAMSLQTARSLVVAVSGAWLVLIAAWIVALLPTLVWRPLERRGGSPVSALEQMVVKVVVVLGFLIYFLANALDMSLASIGAASGVLTIVLGIALQNIILDLFSGILLNLEKPFRLLNFLTVSAGGSPVHGQVRNMNWRTTQIQTRDNDIVSIPNSIMAKATINNHATPVNATRWKLEFVLDAGAEPQRARGVMRAGVLRSIEAGLVLEQPPPSVVIREFEDYGIRYRVMFYLNLNTASDSQAVTSVAENVLEALAEAGIDLAFRSNPIIFESGQEKGIAGSGSRRPPSPNVVPLQRVRPAAARAIDDARAILAPHELESVRKSWALIKPLGAKAGALFYDRLFEIAPPLRALFRSDAQAQRVKFMTMLNMLVKGLNHPDTVLETLADLGLKHRGYGIAPADYGAVGAALLWTLEKGLGEGFDEPTRAAWTKLYSKISAVMIGASEDEVA